MALESHSQSLSGSGGVDVDNPPFSRVFIVCGRNLSTEEVKDAFSVYGTVEDVRMVKDKITRENKGICFVKFSKASSAAMAIEYLDGKVIGNDSKPIKASGFFYYFCAQPSLKNKKLMSILMNFS